MEHLAEKVVNEKLSEISDEIRTLQDLFSRRLMEDKQKKQLIQVLTDEAEYAFMKPFLYEIILLLDRLEQVEDDFSSSIKEELYNIFHQRGLEIISVGQEFDPALMKAVRVVDSSNVDMLTVSETIRKGYQFCGKVLRPSEVIVQRPHINNGSEKKEEET